MTRHTHDRLSKEVKALTPAERMERFYRIQAQAFAMMSPEGREQFERRNRRIRRIHRDGYTESESI